MNIICLQLFILIINFSLYFSIKQSEINHYFITYNEIFTKQRHLLKLLREVETLEKRYGNIVSGGLIFEDGNNENSYTLEWYDKYPDLYWNYDKDCLFILLWGYHFPAYEFSCVSITECHAGPFVFDLIDRKYKKLYTNMMIRYTKIFKKRIQLLTL